MKRIYQLMTAIVIALFIVLLPSMVKAADEEKTITLEGVYITSPAGEYKTGDTIKFEARFSENLASNTNIPTLSIKIGEKKESTYNGKVENNIIKYEFEVTDYIAGKVTFESYEKPLYGVMNEAGDMVTFEESVNDFANSIELMINTPEWTDLSNIKYSIDVDEYNYKIKFENIDYKENHYYYAFFTHNDEKLDIEKEENNKIKNTKYMLYNGLESLKIDSEIELSGDIYLYIVEEQLDYSKSDTSYTNKILIEKEKITRPEPKGLTERIFNYYFVLGNTGKSTIFMREPFSEGRKLNIKIGKISDKTILNAIKNKETLGMTQFLNYAKQQTDGKTYTVIGNGSTMLNAENIDIEVNDGEYYYAYFSVDNENGKYVDVEDVMLYQPLTIDEEEPWLISMNDEKFKWYESDDSTPTVTPAPEEDGKDDTTIKTDKLPQTGVGIGLTLSILLVALFGVVMFKKVRDYKEI